MNNGKKIRENRLKRRKREKVTILSICTIVVVFGIAGLFIWKSNQQSMTLMSEMDGLWVYDSVTSYEFDVNGKGILHLSDEQYHFEYKVRGNDAKIDFLDDIVLDCTYGISFEDGYLILEGKDGTAGGTYKLEELKM